MSTHVTLLQPIPKPLRLEDGVMRECSWEEGPGQCYRLLDPQPAEVPVGLVAARQGRNSVLLLPVALLVPDVAIYPDDSGSARECMLRQLADMQEFVDKIAAVRAFVQRHLDTLTGLRWRYYAWSKGDIELSAGAYRGSYTKAADIARLWPGAKWTRKKASYQPDDWLVFDWLAEFDGVTLRIEKAEEIRLRKEPEHEDGGPVDLAATEEEAPAPR